MKKKFDITKFTIHTPEPQKISVNEKVLSVHDDIALMAKQDMLYNIIKDFLKTDLAIRSNISGINVHIENGYVNAEWKFDKRTKKDIKD